MAVAMGVVADLMSGLESGGHCGRLEMIGPGAFSKKQVAIVVSKPSKHANHCAFSANRAGGLFKGVFIWQSIMPGTGLSLSIANRLE